METTTLLAIVWTGATIGVFLRSMMPYWKKLAEGYEGKFERKYAFTALMAWMAAMSTASVIVGQFDLAADVPWWVTLLLSILYGATWSASTNRWIPK